MHPPWDVRALSPVLPRCRSKKAKKLEKVATSSEGSSGSEEDVEWVEKKPSESLAHHIHSAYVHTLHSCTHICRNCTRS